MFALQTRRIGRNHFDWVDVRPVHQIKFSYATQSVAVMVHTAFLNDFRENRMIATVSNARPSREWSVDRILALQLSLNEIGNLRANALNHGNEEVAQICEDALAVLRGKNYERDYLSGRPAESVEVIEAFFQGISKYRQLKGTKSYPARTMQMVRNHGVVETMRLTGTQGDTRTLVFMASKNCLHLTSEWHVSTTFAPLFTNQDREKALARLVNAGLLSPSGSCPRASVTNACTT